MATSTAEIARAVSIPRSASSADPQEQRGLLGVGSAQRFRSCQDQFNKARLNKIRLKITPGGFRSRSSATKAPSGSIVLAAREPSLSRLAAERADPGGFRLVGPLRSATPLIMSPKAIRSHRRAGGRGRRAGGGGYRPRHRSTRFRHHRHRKPKGLSCIRRWACLSTLVNALIAHADQPVRHRRRPPPRHCAPADKETTGLMVAAKNDGRAPVR